MTISKDEPLTTPGQLGGGLLATALLALPAPAVASDETTALSPIEITGGTLFSRTESAVVQPINVLEGEQLERRRAGTIGETLDGEPGIANADFGPGVGRPVIRGLQGARIEMLEDGMRTSDVSDEGVDHVVANDPLRAERVEIIRGPATLLYGSGAAGGVVNVVTGRFDPAIGDRVSGSVYGSYSGNANDRQGSARLDVPVGENVALRADTSARRTDDFDIKGYQTTDGRGRRGTLINSDIASDAWSVTGMWSGHAGYVGLGYSHWDAEYGIPEPFDARPESEGGQSDEYERIFADYDRVDLRSELYNPMPGFTSLRANLAYTEFRQDEVEFEYERTSDGGQLDERETEAVFRQDELDARLELAHDPIAGFTGVVGLDTNHQDFVAEDPREGRDFFVRPVETRELGLFSVQERPTHFGQLEFGARIGQVHSDPSAVSDPQVESVERNGETVAFQRDPGTRRFTNFSASVGAMVDLDASHRVRTSLMRAERAPSTEQLYAFGRHGAADTFEVGNPDLRSETYLNLETTLERHAGTLRYEATAFYNRVDDFTYFQFIPDDDGNPRRVDENGEEDSDGVRLVFNDQDDVHLYGLELRAALDVEAAPVPLTLRASGDLLRGRLRDGGNLPRMTPPRAGVGADVEWRELDASADYRRVFRQRHTGEAEQPTAGYHLISASVGWRPSRAPGLRVFLRGNNLLNEYGRRHQSYFRDSAPIIGRTVTAGLRYDFGG
ncbi:TonB-dependent receptor [Aquisalimonas sp.]|uniref:TonB-dependent receptor n=1 Tax=Aquisalimonas sp. TaxID=1872621 RepID=UPI0025BF7971|nr:TonB-dependent receptor [Aquisalimonas sp.]